MWAAEAPTLRLKPSHHDASTAPPRMTIGKETASGAWRREVARDQLAIYDQTHHLDMENKNKNQ